MSVQEQRRLTLTGLAAVMLAGCIGLTGGASGQAGPDEATGRDLPPGVREVPPTRAGKPAPTPQEPPAAPQMQAPAQVQAQPQPPAPVVEDPSTRLVREIEALLDELQQLRLDLARARLEATEARREADELRQFIEDHEELGRDFQEYRAIRQIEEEEARQRELERRRAAYEQRQAEREARRAAIRAQRRVERTGVDRREAYEDADFMHIGMDVYAGPMAYHYGTERGTSYDIDYVPGIGDFIDVDENVNIDFSSMTISGSILNGGEGVRDIGVAIVFFNEYGSQVGQEVVQIQNARPDVPYPFTSVIDMALDRPFDSVSIYPLYADPAGAAPPEPQPVPEEPAGEDAAAPDAAWPTPQPQDAGGNANGG